MRGLHRQEVAAGRALGSPRSIVATLAVMCAPLSSGIARAEHDMAAMSAHHAHEGSELSAGVAVEAAQFDTMAYVGSYQGITPSIGWMRGRFGAGATLGLYHLNKNGLSLYGIGDAMFTGHATVWATETVQTGLALHLMAPTGSELDGLGMGHVMATPSAWASWRRDRLSLWASAGYSWALTGGAGQHNHGPSPLVDPMNMQEVTWSAGGDLDVAHGIRVGAHAQGGIPTGVGSDRVIGAGRVAWGTPRVSTAFELQLGLAGDPFTIRGVVETALRF